MTIRYLLLAIFIAVVTCATIDIDAEVIKNVVTFIYFGLPLEQLRVVD